MPTKKKEEKPAVKKRTPSKAAKTNPEHQAWERRVYLYNKFINREVFTAEEKKEADLVCRRRGDLVPGLEPAK